jgi:hypothetical protein
MMNEILKNYLKNMLLLTTVLAIAGPIGLLFLDIDLKNYYGTLPYLLSIYALFFGVLSLLVWKKVKVKSWWKVSRAKKFFVWFFDVLGVVYSFVYLHWIGIVAFGIAMFLIPFKFFQTGDVMFFVLGIVIICMGISLDSRRLFHGI